MEKEKNPSQPKEDEIKFTRVGDLKRLTEEQAIKFLANFVPRMNNMLDYQLVLEDINMLRGITLHHPELMFLGDSFGHTNGSLPISTLIPYLCDCVDLEEPQIQASVLQYISHLSYTFKKVLAPELGKILSNLFTLYKKTQSKQIRKMAYTTIKVVAKYSGDLKTLVYILLMPTEMRERYKLIASRMLEVMLTGVERDPNSNLGMKF